MKGLFKPFTESRPRSYVLGAMLLVLIGVVIGLGVSASLDTTRTPAGTTHAAAAGSSALGAPESPFVSVVESALPAVVFIDVRKRVGGSASDDPQEELFRRFPDIQLAGAPERLRSTFIAGIKHLPVTYTPGG